MICDSSLLPFLFFGMKPDEDDGGWLFPSSLRNLFLTLDIPLYLDPFSRTLSNSDLLSIFLIS